MLLMLLAAVGRGPWTLQLTDVMPQRGGQSRGSRRHACAGVSLVAIISSPSRRASAAAQSRAPWGTEWHAVLCLLLRPLKPPEICRFKAVGGRLVQIPLTLFLRIRIRRRPSPVKYTSLIHHTGHRPRTLRVIVATSTMQLRTTCDDATCKLHRTYTTHDRQRHLTKAVTWHDAPSGIQPYMYRFLSWALPLGLGS